MNKHSSLQTVIVGLVVLSVAISTSGVGAVSAQNQQAGYGVDIVVPGGLSTGSNQTVGVRINNTANTNDVFSPVVEVPLGTLNLSTDAVETVYVTADGEREARTAEVQNSTITDGESLFIFGENVPAGQNRTYYFNITVESAGNRSLTAEVRPLYNEDVAVQTTEEVYAKGTGTLSVSVVDDDGNDVTDADITVDGDPAGTGEQSVLEGQHTVRVSNADALGGEILSSATVSVDPLQTKQVTFVVRDSLSQPGVLRKTGTARVVPYATGQVTEAPTATRPKRVDVTFLLSTAGGETIVGHKAPNDVTPLSAKSATSTAGAVDKLSTHPNAYRVQSNQDTEITVTYVGYRLGDVTRDAAVTRDDAADIAHRLANDTASRSISQYGDVNGDGQVTAADAMMIAQYTADNRNATYAQEGSQ